MRTYCHFKFKRSKQKKRNYSNMTISQLYCSQCGKKMFVPRNAGQQREEQHVKHMFCVHCQKKTAHIEVREFDTPMPTGYYIRRKFRLAPGVEAYHTANFWYDGQESLYVYIYSKTKKNMYMIYDAKNRTILRNTGFPHEISAQYTKIVGEKMPFIISHAQNCLAA